MGYTKILVANRGEIAVRILRTATAMGYDTVAVFSDADATALHAEVADHAVRIGPPEAASSYLSIERILAAAAATRADAVHPGYGFLSENAAFARACDEAGITFIGPHAAAIELMGSKRLAKEAMEQAGLPCIPGYQGEDQSDERLTEETERIGLPVMVKAVAGGGGRGMRIVHTLADLAEALRSARAEAHSAFGSGELILERALRRPRHVEVQVLADRHGRVIHLGERDCSVQRRYQKVIEESPSPAVDDALRRQLGEAAVTAARACDYVNAGTVEFLLDEDGSFYFLEMNTRLQVEHPVTELVTGLDLVEWQLRIAAGEAIPFSQADVRFSGHAIEARVYAEDPSHDYRPQTGTIRHWSIPTRQGVRVDTGFHAGSAVHPYYDALLAKVIAHGTDREQARRRLAKALREMSVLGVRTNRTHLADICSHPAFAAGNVTTGFLRDTLAVAKRPPSQREVASAALLYFMRSGRRGQSGPGAGWVGIEADQWLGWRNTDSVDSLVQLEAGETRYTVRICRAGRGVVGPRFEVSLGSEVQQLEVIADTAPTLVVIVDEVRVTACFNFDDELLYLDDAVFRDTAADPPSAGAAAGTGLITAPMDGAISAVFAQEGDRVSTGQLLLVMEAMKMEHQLRSDIDGLVTHVAARPGAQVKTRQLLMQVHADNVEGGPHA